MSTFKYRLLSNWHVARIIRAALAVFMLVLSIQTRDWVIGLASALLLLMAVTNTGCCGPQGCAVPTKPAYKDNAVDEFNKHTEIK